MNRRVSLGIFHGRRRLQPVYRAMHLAALAGLGYGNSTPATNGEYRALEMLRRVWPERPVVFDVGAHRGEWTARVLELAPAANVYAFEPAEEPFARLVDRLDGRARAFNFGLSDAPGSMTMWAPPGLPELGSVHQRDLAHVHLAAEAVATVTMTTADAFCAEHQVERVDLMKLDVEGHEAAVLRGASSALEQGMIDAIQFEFGGTDIDSRTFLRDFVRRLEPAGYTVYRLLRDGLAPVKYTEREEIFAYANFLALSDACRRRL